MKTRRCKIQCLSAAQVITIDLEHFKRFFDKEDQHKMITTLFKFNEAQVKAKVE